jgi:hypothetical protein
MAAGPRGWRAKLTEARVRLVESCSSGNLAVRMRYDNATRHAGDERLGVGLAARAFGRQV